MGVTFRIHCVLRQAGPGILEFIESIIEALDRGGLRYHYGEPGALLVFPEDDLALQVEVRMETSIPLNSPNRIARAAQLLWTEAQPNRHRRTLEMSLDCSKSTGNPTIHRPEELASVSLNPHNGLKGLWIMMIEVDANATYVEEGGGRSCVEQFVIDGLMRLFDTQVAVFGYCGTDVPELDESQLRQVVEGVLPTVFGINIFSPSIAKKLKLDTPAGLDRLTRYGRVIWQSSQGTLFWDVSGLGSGVDEFELMSAQEKLDLFGFGKRNS